MSRNIRCSAISYRKYIFVYSINTTVYCFTRKDIHLLRLVSFTTPLPPREKSACSSIVCCYKRKTKKTFHFSAFRTTTTIKAATLVAVY